MRKVNSLIACSILAISASAFAADGHEHGHEHEPLHGGVVVEASEMDFELVAKADLISLYVRDHGKAVKMQGASGKLTLIKGADKNEVQLAPAGEKLEAKGTFDVSAGAKAVAVVTLSGKKPVSVRFALK